MLNISSFTRKERSSGFTLVEIIVVIMIISLLAGVILVKLGEARAKARDAKRKADLAVVADALKLHYLDQKTFQVANTGNNNSSEGWLTYTGGTYTTSIAQGLVTLGYLSSVPYDPATSGPNAVGPTNGYSGYMYYAPTTTFSEGGCLFANLEYPTTEDTATMTNAPVAAATKTTITGTYLMDYALCI